MSNNVIALGGLGYPIRKFFSREVRHIACPAFGFSQRYVARIADEITDETVLVGFSAGATVALQIAGRVPLVTRCIAHSPAFRRFGVSPVCRYQLYRTTGDQFSTYEDSEKCRDHILESGVTHQVLLADLPVVDWSPRRWNRVEMLMHRLNHQFHNILPVINLPGSLAPGQVEP